MVVTVEVLVLGRFRGSIKEKSKKVRAKVKSETTDKGGNVKWCTIHKLIKQLYEVGILLRRCNCNPFLTSVQSRLKVESLLPKRPEKRRHYCNIFSKLY